MTTPPTLDPDAIERRLLAELDCDCGHGLTDHRDGPCAAMLDLWDWRPTVPCPCERWVQR